MKKKNLSVFVFCEVEIIIITIIIITIIISSSLLHYLTNLSRINSECDVKTEKNEIVIVIAI